MQAFGAELVVVGADFDECRPHAARFADERGYHFVPSFHADLVRGVATYALELFQAVPDLDAVYVPIGMGSGICGLITVRDLLGLKTEIIGVVADTGARRWRLSFEQGASGARPTRPPPSPTAWPAAIRVAEPIDIICEGAARIVRVGEDEIAEAMRAYYEDTHNLAEGAGAAPLAALMQERERMRGKRVALDPQRRQYRPRGVRRGAGRTEHRRA